MFKLVLILHFFSSIFYFLLKDRYTQTVKLNRKLPKIIVKLGIIFFNIKLNI